MKINKDWIAIILILSIGILYWSVSLGSPIVFGDEGYYGFSSREIAETQMLPEYEGVWDTDIWHAKFLRPPMFLLYESFGFLFSEMFVKFLITLPAVLCGLMFYIFLKKFGKENTGIISSVAMMTTPIFVTYAVLNYVDSLIALFFITSVYFFYRAISEDNKKLLILTGIFTGAAILTKAAGPFLIILFFLYLIFTKQFKKHYKKIFTIILIAGVIVFPWVARNLVLYGDVCYKFGGPNCEADIDKELTSIEGLEFEGRTQGGGGESELMSIGPLNFSNFTLGWIIMILFLLGITFVKEDNLSILMGSWLLLSIPFLYWGSTRVEDAARFIVPIIPAVAFFVGTFLSKLYDFLKPKSKIIGIFIITILLMSMIYYGNQKIDSMKSVKNFSDGFFEACNWIRLNTQKDDILFGVYIQQAAYSCERSISAGKDHGAEIRLANDNRAYDYLKEYGYDYIWIPVFTVNQIAYQESIPVSFIGYIESSDKYEKVFDNTPIHGQGGVIIYEVL